ncbi:hypothetical protein [Spiroplasma tabanidicola]|uniref:Uncharacterized protein n=1 Tax=Spiroplasma tabanidicola TaxID=324079 RepID=A0A6I6C9A9_9MOLU|nr:hypothetical protein [Spiroplasma tabanidicola]QGS51495.1 hypothetical protein STABA_v1c01280 [Spiroplasma tabanidicola]
MKNQKAIKGMLISILVLSAISFLAHIFSGYLVDLTEVLDKNGWEYHSKALYATISFDTVSIIILFATIVIGSVYFKNNKENLFWGFIITAVIGSSFSSFFSYYVNRSVNVVKIIFLISIFIISTLSVIFKLNQFAKNTNIEAKIELLKYYYRISASLIIFCALLGISAISINGYNEYRNNGFVRNAVYYEGVFVLLSLIFAIVHLSSKQTWSIVTAWILTGFYTLENVIIFASFIVVTVLVIYSLVQRSKYIKLQKQTDDVNKIINL